MVTKIFENKIFEADPNSAPVRDSSTGTSVDSSIQNKADNNTDPDNSTSQDNKEDNNTASDNQADSQNTGTDNQENDQEDTNTQTNQDSTNTSQQTNDTNTASNNVLALPPELSMESLIKASGIIGAIRAIGNSIVRRFRKCAKILLKMQNDFISQEGLDVSKILPGSGLVNRLTNFFSGIFKDKENNTNIGIYSFVNTYVAEVQDDYNVALNAFNTLSLSSKNESFAGGVNSIREFNTVFHLNEDDNDPASPQNNSAASFDDVISKNGNLFIVKDGKETKLNVTQESTREVCAAVIASFLNKYTNQEKIYKKLGIDTVNEINDKNYNQFMQVLKLYKGATATKDGGITNANIFGRVNVAYKKMVDSYMRIGQNVINNFSTYAKQAKTKDGKQMSENNSNLLSSSSEKLQFQWDRQSDFFVGAFDKVVLIIIQSEPYQKYIDFIMNKVMPVLKSGEAKPEDVTMPFTPQEGDEVILNQTDTNGNTKTIVGKVKSYNKETGETEITPESEVKDASNNVKTEKDGSKTIQDPKQSLVDIEDKTPIKTSKDDAVKGGIAKVADDNKEQNNLEDNNADEYYVYEFTGKNDTKYKIIAKGEAQISAEPAKSGPQQEQGKAATGEAAKTRMFAPDETLDEDDTQNKSDNIKELVIINADGSKSSKINVKPDININDQDVFDSIKSAGFDDVADKSNQNDSKAVAQEFDKIDKSVSAENTATLNDPKTLSSIIKTQAEGEDSENSENTSTKVDDNTLNEKVKEISEAIGYTMRILVEEIPGKKGYVYKLFNGINKNDTKYNYSDPSKPNYIHIENKNNGNAITYLTNILCIKERKFNTPNDKTLYNKCLRFEFNIGGGNRLLCVINGQSGILFKNEYELDKFIGIAQKKEERLKANNQGQQGQVTSAPGTTQGGQQPQQPKDSSTDSSTSESLIGNQHIFEDAPQGEQSIQNNGTPASQQPAAQQNNQPFKIASQLTQEGIGAIQTYILNMLKTKFINNLIILPDDKLNTIVESFGSYLTMSYECLLNESSSYLAKIKRTVANTNDPLFKNANFYLVSKSAYTDGTYFDTPTYIKESLERTISKNDNYDKLALQAKNESSFNLIPLSESHTYYTSMPVNKAGFGTIGNILYEAVSLIHFDNNSKIDLVQYLGTNKIN